MTMQDLIASVTAQTTVEASLLSLISGLTDQLKAAVGSNNLGSVDAIVTQIQANTAAMQAAVTANTPAATPAAPATTPVAATPTTAPSTSTSTATPSTSAPTTPRDG